MEKEESVKLAVLEQKFADFVNIVNKIDDAIGKLSEVNVNVGKMLAVHEERIEQAMKANDILIKMILRTFLKKKNYLKIIADFSSEILIDDAHFALAELFRSAFNQPEKAMDNYEEIIFNHPDSIHFVTSKKHFRRLRDKNTAQTTLDL